MRSDGKVLGEMATVAQWVGVVIGALLFFHVVSGGKWQRAHTAFGVAGAGLVLLAQI